MELLKMIGKDKSFCWYLPLTRNNGLEFQIIWLADPYCYFDFEFRWTRKQDHAGLNISFCIGKFCLDINILDNRHWDCEANRWE